MTIADLILELQGAPHPARSLDNEIALAVGFHKKTVSVEVNGKKTSKVVWLSPDNKEGRVPNFTGVIDHSKGLADMLAPSCRAAITWGRLYASAKINNGPQFNAVSPSMALCAAALNTIQPKPNFRDQF